MYQFPVKGLEKIRRTRRKVKNILGEFGLEACLNLGQELQEYYPGDNIFDATDWCNLSDGFDGRWRKKWEYRTQGLCCTLCDFSTRSWHTYKTHVQRYHDEEEHMCKLAACASCPFIAHPRLVCKHLKLFHNEDTKSETSAAPQLPPRAVNGTTFQCRRCHIQDTLLYSVKKHVLLYHYTSTLNKYAGQRTEQELVALGDRSQKFYCKKCYISAESSEHLLYHLLTSDKHKELDVHIRSLIFETDNKKQFPALAPKAQGPSPVMMMKDQPAATATLATSGIKGVENGGSAVIAAPGTSQAFLPTQASALVQLASAEAKGLLRPGVPMPFQNTQMSRPALPPPPPPNSIPPNQMPVRVGLPNQSQLQPVSRQIVLPPGVRLNVPGVRPPAPQSFSANPRLPLNQPPSGGTMLTSQSLLSHLIPTGNKVDGLPTYTLAPLQVLSVQANNSQGVSKPQLPASQNNPAAQQIKQNSGLSTPKQTKKWITCPICNELFPSDIYESHPEVHKEAAKLPKVGLAARAPFLKKMPDKTVKCLTCKILISEKGVFEHLLHGMNCLFCSGLFYSIKQLVDHIQIEHNVSRKSNCDFMRREYRLYTDDSGNLLFPYFDIRTTAPKLIMGEKELNLALVTSSLDLIFVKMLPNNPQGVNQQYTPCKMPTPKPDSTECPFCSEKLLNKECYHMHLKEKHFIVPTLHAILKTPSYRCLYCGGVYTGKTTTKAIIVHLAKCRSAPKSVRESDKLTLGLAVTPKANRAHGSYPAHPRQITGPTPTSAQASVPSTQPPESEAEMQSKMRLEIAFREAMEANRKEREERLARKRKLERDRLAGLTLPSPDMVVDPTVKLALDPAGMELRTFEDRREFVNKYFNTQPYPLKKEIIALSGRLLLNKTDVACQISSKRTRCMKNIQKMKAVVLLGFNMTEVIKLKHDLLIPEIEPEKVATVADTDMEVDQE
ncbi:activity-dependent neuroprotector homeobox protein 2b [Danio aesculapii]|uniref:activity-dependent neuroprotector homeobox protein 2b n=1 Tax=Danio aesculapii TaxID=1142201 RepID=UPI0024C0DB98|nr:activity-dependent neuroprotector homeobox protein 2b [Danio aesculapii]XP_056335795.1 activity-dependent neuroprotector homeobox protein 2b [Danio aesculapii]